MNKYIQKLIEASKENPLLPIITFTDTEVVASDDYGSWMGSIYGVRKDWICQLGDINYIGEEDVEDYLRENHDQEDEEIRQQITGLKESGEMYEAIIIYIGA